MNGQHLIRMVGLTVVCLVPWSASAQTQSPWSIVNATTRICPAFIQTGDIRQARSDAESHGYRALRVEPDNLALEADPGAPPRAIWMTGGALGSLHLSRAYGRAICAVGIEQATVLSIAEMAGPKLNELGYQPELQARDNKAASWTTPSARALVMPSAHHLPGVEMTYVAF